MKPQLVDSPEAPVLQPTYDQLVAAISRTTEQLEKFKDNDFVRGTLEYQLQRLLEREEEYFGVTAPVAEKKKRKYNMSPENRLKAAERMRAMVKSTKAARQAAT